MSIIGQNKNTCIVDTVYALLLYILMTKDEDIVRTTYFLGGALPKSAEKVLPYVIRLSTKYEDYCTLSHLLKFRLRALKYRLLYVMGTEIFAQDHLHFSSQLLGRQSYTMIEDSPGFCWEPNYDTMYPYNVPAKNLRNRIGRIVKYGPVKYRTWGRNTQCIDRWVTMENSLHSKHLQGVKCTKIPTVEELWENASDYKRNLICRIYDVKPSWKEELKKYNTIIFTDPISVEAGLSDEEVISLYMPMIEKYGAEHIVIKPHPRDTVDWEKYIPQAKILKTKTPMQILSLMGIDFKRAITIQSSAVSSMSKNTEIVFLGTDFDPKLKARFGHRSFLLKDQFTNVIYPYGKDE